MSLPGSCAHRMLHGFPHLEVILLSGDFLSPWPSCVHPGGEVGWADTQRGACRALPGAPACSAANAGSLLSLRPLQWH